MNLPLFSILQQSTCITARKAAHANQSSFFHSIDNSTLIKANESTSTLDLAALNSIWLDWTFRFGTQKPLNGLSYPPDFNFTQRSHFCWHHREWHGDLRLYSMLILSRSTLETKARLVITCPVDNVTLQYLILQYKSCDAMAMIFHAQGVH
jgi:hypothetical protein